MDKDRNKGLADNQDGEFVLNESGTSVTVDADQEFPEDKEVTDSEDAIDEGNAENAEEIKE